MKLDLLKTYELFVAAPVLIIIVCFAISMLLMQLQEFGTRQERRVKKLKQRVEEERLKRELLELEGRKSETTKFIRCNNCGKNYDPTIPFGHYCKVHK